MCYNFIFDEKNRILYQYLVSREGCKVAGLPKAVQKQLEKAEKGESYLMMDPVELERRQKRIQEKIELMQRKFNESSQNLHRKG